MTAVRLSRVMPVLAAAAILAAAAATVLRAPAPAPGIGGPFELTAHDGRRLSSRDLLGKPFAIFFGFTRCPDICPTTLLDLSRVIAGLGEAASGMHFLFVSVDPEHDTPELLRLYLSSFDPHLTGLTGTPAEIAAVAKAYRAYYEKVPTSDGYTMNHTAVIYLMGADGRFRVTMRAGDPDAEQIAILRQLLAKSGKVGS